MYMNGVINGQEHRCLIDTGSQENLIPTSMVQGMKIEPVLQKLVAANGSEIELKGTDNA